MDWYKKSPDSIQTLKSTAIGSGAVIVEIVNVNHLISTMKTIDCDSILIRIQPSLGTIYLLGFKPETKSLVENQGIIIDFSILRNRRESDEEFSNEICEAFRGNKIFRSDFSNPTYYYQIHNGPIILL